MIVDLLANINVEAFIYEEPNGIFRGSFKIHIYNGREVPLVIASLSTIHRKIDTMW